MGFRLHRRGIERLVAPLCGESQRTARRPSDRAAGDRQQVLAFVKGARLVAVRDDRLGERGADARDPGKERRRGRIEFHPHCVHCVLDHPTQRLAEPVLVDIVLVLSDADRLRLDLHELCQRVLQAPRDRHRTAKRHVEVREFPGRKLRDRVDRGARLRDDHLRGLLRQPVAQDPGHHLLGLAAASAVADRDELDALLADQARERRLRPADIALGLERIDRRRIEHLPRRVDHRGLDDGADAGVEGNRRPCPSRRRQQQVPGVAGEDTDRLLLRAAAEGAGGWLAPPAPPRCAPPAPQVVLWREVIFLSNSPCAA